MLHQLCGARIDAVCIGYGDWQVRRCRGKFYALRVLGEFNRDFVLSWRDEVGLDWPALNMQLHLNHTESMGISLTNCSARRLRCACGAEAKRCGPIRMPRLAPSRICCRNAKFHPGIVTGCHCFIAVKNWSACQEWRLRQSIWRTGMRLPFDSNCRARTGKS